MNYQQKIITFLLLLSTFYLFFSNFVYGKSTELYFFWGSGCPHCAIMDVVLKEISASNLNLSIRSFETWYNPNNQILLNALAERYDFTVRGVPVIFIGNTVIDGAGQAEINKLKLAVENCSINDCPSPKDRIKTVKNNIILNWPNIGILAGVIIFIFLIMNLFKNKK